MSRFKFEIIEIIEKITEELEIMQRKL